MIESNFSVIKYLYNQKNIGENQFIEQLVY